MIRHDMDSETTHHTVDLKEPLSEFEQELINQMKELNNTLKEIRKHMPVKRVRSDWGPN